MNSLHIFVGLMALLIFWLFYQYIKSKRVPSYEELLDEQKRLENIVAFWRYPDGDYVQQHQRLKLFKQLRSTTRSIRQHPDNPYNVQ